MEIKAKAPVIIQWRTMVIPEETAKIGVKTDRNSEVVEFRMPRNYQGIDMEEKTWFADVYNADKELFDVSLLSKAVDSNILILRWTVGPVSASEDGTVNVRLRAVDDEFVWQTETGTFRVTDSFMPLGPDEDPGMTWLSELTLEMRTYVTGAAGSAEEAGEFSRQAAAAAERAEQAVVNAPYIDPETSTWRVWSMDTETYENTGVLASGKNFSPLSIYESLEELQQAHPVGAEGQSYFVMESGMRTVYFWDVDRQDWSAAGDIVGSSPAINGIYPGENGYALTAGAIPSEGESNVQADVNALSAAISELSQEKLDLGRLANDLVTTTEGYALDARQGKVLSDAVNTKLNAANVLNYLTATVEGYALDARQGKALKDALDAKFLAANVVNNLTTTAAGYALDARQGKALSEAKLNIANVANNLTTTGAGYALDARQGKALNDKLPSSSNPVPWASGGLGASVANATAARTQLGLKNGAVSQMLSGTVSINVPAGGVGSVNVTFSPAFSGTPKVGLAVHTTRPDIRSASAGTTTSTGTAVHAACLDGGGGSVTVQWIAVYTG